MKNIMETDEYWANITLAERSVRATRLKFERMPKDALKKHFNDLSARAHDQNLKASQRFLAREEAKIAGLVLSLNGKGAQG